MTDNITCFKLHWYDCGLSCGESVVQEDVTVYRNDNCVVFKELNGHGVICSCEIIHIEKDKTRSFFELLERNCDEWENDYIVQVCDGSRWEVRMWHSSHKIRKICGTVEYPPHGKEIEEYIRSFFADGNRIIELKLFGCS